jgi:hypothetical protein
MDFFHCLHPMTVVAFRVIMPFQSFHTKFQTANRKILLTVCACLFLGTPALSATPLEQDPKGFFGSLWGKSLEGRSDLKEIESIDTMHIYTVKIGPPQIEGIVMESVKLYTLEEKYARALFHYQGEANHKSLLHYLETQFGKAVKPQGSMMRGLSQQYTWRGPETQITLTYHGFRERGFLAAESRIFSPLFLDAMPEHSY